MYFFAQKLKKPTHGPTMVLYRGGDGGKGGDGGGIKLLINIGANRNSKGVIYTLRN